MKGSKLNCRAVVLLLWAAGSMQLLFFSAGANTQTPADAITLEQEGKLPEAAEAWRAVIQKNPSDARAYASLGVVFSKEQKYPEAAAAYKKALALNPSCQVCS